ncbi:DUF5666 domain-containing protein [Rhodohalobacter halophilus]|uniref:DUF5666 domain-containing protein n=1 Tax=Rhodohalobacter halophilus TaxID=1812810 RepID=UPI00083FC128|nr:DUF5666 domain-containing protein [Rhodohalobacter halophilus]
MKSKILLGILICAGFLLHGCTIDSFDENRSVLNEDELRITGQIIGESVSENEAGLLSSFSEAFAIPTNNGLASGNSVLSTGSFRNLQNYSYEYNPAEGKHLVQFSRIDAITGAATDFNLEYIFRNSNGEFIEFPNQNSQQIESLEFTGHRTGQIETAAKSSVYNRKDRFILDGISDQSATLKLDGSHTGEGRFVRNELNNRVERDYLLEINFLDVRIEKGIVEQNRSFRKGVNGAVSYESTIQSNQNGSNPESKIVNGTLDFNGDGTALLKFQQTFNTFRIRLENGDVFDDDEFEGLVMEVNTEDQTFRISNGQIIHLTDETEIDDDSDYFSLEDVASAISNGQRIVAEGDYYRPEDGVNLWIATEMEFEIEENEFEDFVLSLNPNDSTLTLATNETFYFTAKTDIEFDDGFESLQDVADALNLNLPVFAEGDFYIDPETDRYILTDVDFELELSEFEELIQSVDLENQIITLINGRQILITDETIIDAEGDLISLEEVVQALEDGEEIEADGEYYYSSTDAIWIVYSVKFEVD